MHVAIRDARGAKLAADRTRQVERGVPRAARGEQPPARRAKRPRHLGHLGRTDLVARGADRRADPDEQVTGDGAERRRHRGDRLGHHAAQRPSPAAMRDACRPVRRVEEHNRGAVRHQDRERGAGHRGDHGVGRRERGGRVRGPVVPPAGECGRDDRDPVGMPLVGDGQPVHAERQRQAAPVLCHRLWVVPYMRAKVEAAVVTLTHPAVPRRDDRGHLFGVEGKCAQRKGSAHHSTLIHRRPTMLLGRDMQVMHLIISVASEVLTKWIAIPENTFHHLKKYVASTMLIACAMKTNYFTARNRELVGVSHNNQVIPVARANG